MVKKKQKVKSGTNNFALIGIAVFAFFLFINVKNGVFLTNWDDDAYIVNNPSVHKLSWENLKQIFSSFYVFNYQPLLILFYAFEFYFFKLQPSGYHVINLLFHTANIFLVFKLFQRMKMSDVICYTVAILFAIHPTRVESVAWISELKDLMYALFYLLSLIYYLKFRERNSVKLYFLSFVFFVCSILSKSMGITLPVILVLIDIFMDRKFDLKKLLNKIPFFILAIFFGVLAIYSQQGEAMAIAKNFNLYERLVLIFVAIGKYFVLVLAPFNLSAIQYYPIEPGETLPVWIYFSVIAVIVVIFLALWNEKFRFEIVFGLMFFFISIGMVLQIVPFGHAIIAERYTYIPYLGLFFIIGVFIDHFLNNKTITTLVYFMSSVFLIFLATLTYKRIEVWKNSITLFTDVVEKFPNSGNAYMYRGNVYAYSKQYDLAIKDYAKSVDLNPTYYLTHYNKAWILSAIEKYEEALVDYNKTIELNPDYIPAYYNKAYNLKKLKRYDEAILFYQKTISKDSSFKSAYLGIGDIFIAKHEPQKAILNYKKYLISYPKDFNALNGLGIAEYNNNELSLACETWKKAFELGNLTSRDYINKYCK